MRFLLLCCFAWTAAAQNAPPPGQHLVQFDVVVRNAKNPQAGLAANNFKVFDNKQRQKAIALFRINDGRLPHPPARAVPAGGVSNRVDREGNELESGTLVLVDHINTPPASQADLDAGMVRAILSAKPGARIAICALFEDRLELVQDFTTNHALLSEAAQRVRPRADQRSELRAGKDVDASDARTAKALEAIALHLAGLPGRKNLVWFSLDPPMEVWQEQAPGSHPGDWLPPLPAVKSNFNPEIVIAARMLNDAGVAVYSADPRMVTERMVRAFSRNSAQDLVRARAAIADLTGGRMPLLSQPSFHNPRMMLPFEMALEDAEYSYTLGFDSPDEGFHDLRVEAWKGTFALDVRSRTRIYVSEDLPEELEAQREDLFISPLEATQIQLTAGDGSLLVNLADLRLKQDGSGHWRGSVMVASEGQSKLVAIDVDDAGRASSLKLPLPSGKRVIVQDQASGALGSLTLP